MFAGNRHTFDPNVLSILSLASKRFPSERMTPLGALTLQIRSRALEFFPAGPAALGHRQYFMRFLVQRSLWFVETSFAGIGAERPEYRCHIEGFESARGGSRQLTGLEGLR